MQVWIDSDYPGVSDKVVALLLEQERFFQMTGLCIPNLEIFETALHALAESRKRQADRKAYAIFQRLDDYQVQPTLSLYHSLITCMARGRDHGAAKRAEDLLMEAAAKFPPRLESNGERLGISVDTFNVVLTAWAKSELEDGPDRAKNLLLKMDTIDNQQGILKPTASSFTSLIDAYAQMNTWESACLAERTLNALLNYYLTEELDPTLEPNIATWGIVLSCWQRLSKKGSSDAASNAAKLLDRLETLYSDGKLTYGPDAIAYATVLNAFCQCKDAAKEGAKNAELILNEMNERYMDGDDSFKPSSKSIRSVIDAWLKSNRQDAVFKAQEIFKKFDEMDYLSDPSDVSVVKEIYKAFIFAWSKNEDAELAHEYLIDMYNQGLQPDSFCFDKVIEAYTAEEGNTFNEVKEVLKLMEKSNQENELKPNERIYTSFIRAMTKDNIPNLASESYDLLKKMKDLSLVNKGVKPTVFTFNSVLKACATVIKEDPSENVKALKIALSVFNELRAPDTKEEPDHVTYGNMLQCSALLPQGNQREALITSTFQMCCRNGFVNSFVIRDLKTTATEELWRDLCHCPVGDVDVEKLPQEWVKRSKVLVKNKDQEGRKMSSRGGGSRYQKK
jgi:Pentatricopeptide repeat domain